MVNASSCRDRAVLGKGDLGEGYFTHLHLVHLFIFLTGKNGSLTWSYGWPCWRHISFVCPQMCLEAAQQYLCVSAGGTLKL